MLLIWNKNAFKTVMDGSRGLDPAKSAAQPPPLRKAEIHTDQVKVEAFAVVEHTEYTELLFPMVHKITPTNILSKQISAAYQVMLLLYFRMKR